jgi:transposase
MSRPPLTDSLWERIAPMLLPPRPRRFRHCGRKPVDDRKALAGILYVLETGINWEHLPADLGCGSGMTCWRRLRAWTRDGVWPRMQEVLRDELRGADRIDWSRVDRRRRVAAPAAARRDAVRSA